MVVYPSIIHEENGAYWAEFPDLAGCYSDGDTIAETIQNASDALGGYLCSMMDRGIDIPCASDIKEISTDSGFVTMIITDPLHFKKSTRSVKKTLTIPEWLNEEAERRHINFSSVLQKALLSMIE